MKNTNDNTNDMSNFKNALTGTIIKVIVVLIARHNCTIILVLERLVHCIQQWCLQIGKLKLPTSHFARIVEDL